MDGEWGHEHSVRMHGHCGWGVGARTQCKDARALYAVHCGPTVLFVKGFGGSPQMKNNFQGITT